MANEEFDRAAVHFRLVESFETEVQDSELLAKADRAMYAQKAASPRIRPFLASGRIWPTATPLPKPLIN